MQPSMPRPEHIDLHELQRVDIVLVPFDDLPVVHRGRLDRNQFVKPIQRQHEAARMLRQMPRRADQLLGKFKRERSRRSARLRLSSFASLFVDAFLAPAPDHAGERACHVFWEAERFADFAHGAARAIARDTCGERGARPAIGLVNPLDDFLAPLVLEIDIDIGRLAPLFADEALEQQIPAGRDRWR